MDYILFTLKSGRERERKEGGPILDWGFKPINGLKLLQELA